MILRALHLTAVLFFVVAPLADLGWWGVAVLAVAALLLVCLLEGLEGALWWINELTRRERQ